jgi:hypothetical protein
MTVKEIFELRKQGRIEEAYAAIRARYATYRGKYTTLCMFWTAADVFKLRIQQKRFYEATKIFQALRRVLPNIDDKDGHAAGFMRFAGCQLVQLRRDRALVPAGSPAVPALSGSPASSVLSGFPAEMGFPVATVPDGSPSGLNHGQQAVLDCIKAHPGLKVPGISDETGIPAKSIERHIKVLIERNLIEHRGSKKTGGYYAL